MTDRYEGAVGDMKAVHDFAVEQMCLVDHGNDNCGNDDPRLCSISEAYLDLERLLTEAVKALRETKEQMDFSPEGMPLKWRKRLSVMVNAVLTKAEEQGIG